MASKKELRDFKLSFFPWRPKLSTAGQQASMPESEMWKCRNGGPDLDGMISKRPGLTQWGQTLQKPDSTATGSTRTNFVDFLSKLAGFVQADSSGTPAKIVQLTRDGQLQTTIEKGSTSESFLMSFTVPALSTSAAWSVRFMFRGTNLQPYTAAGTVANTFAIRGQGAASTAKEFAIWSDGIRWKRQDNNQYTLVAGSIQAGNGAWNSIEIQVDIGTGQTKIFLNDILIDTVASVDIKNVTLTGTTSFELEWEVEGSGSDTTQYATYLTTIMYNDTVTTPFIDKKIVALHDFQYLRSSSLKTRVILAAAGDYIYHDRGLQNVWRPLHAKQHENVYFSPYRNTLLWTDNNGGTISSVWQWDGIDAPTLLDDAPPVRFLVEHQQRIFAWGDVVNPRRVYYSGDRRPNVWFSPSPTNIEDQFDVILDAGYVELESRGIEVRAALGDFYGLAVIAGEKGYWKLSGSGVFSYKLDGLKVGTGAINAQSFVQAGNDAWSIGKLGVASLAATEKFGDLKAGFPSIPIQNLWNPDTSSGNPIDRTFLNKSRMAYSANQSTIYMAVPLIGDTSAKNIFVFNTVTQGFYGPWEVDAEALVAVELASPVTELIMVGGSNGKAGYFNPYTRTDFNGTKYTLEVETPALNGRSQDPRLVGLEKVWKVLRLFFLPRGDWDVTIKYWTDSDRTEDTQTKTQNTIKAFTLDKDLVIDKDPDAFIHSGEELSFIEFHLGKRGHDFTVNIQQVGDGEDLAIQGYELEGLALGYEIEE